MKMWDLVRYGLPVEIIQLWQREESEHLLPLQESAIRQHDLFGKRNLLVQAPTTSGKTFIGEMAAVQAALRRKKAVYLVPLKALAEEKWADFRQKYAPYGIRVIVSTRDRREFDGDFENGRFDIAVAVYEKFAHLLVRRPERLQEIELVVADELEILSDPDRGGHVEVLLTQVLQSGARLIGLSAVIGCAAKLAQWMDAELILFERRPVELRYGVLHGGVFRYRTYADCAEAQEPLVDAPSDSSWEILTENLRALAERGEPCVVFVKDRNESRRGAELLARRVQLPSASEAIESLRALEPTHSRDQLIDVLSRGVAFHNADLSPQERRIVEHAFRTESLRVIVSTSTLAAGMNLPAQNVFMASDKWRYDARFGMPWRTPILRAEYENMGGRAGRYGSGKQFGRSILIAPTPFDFETLWRRYVEGDREEIEPRVGREPIEDHVVRLIASGACRTEDELAEFLTRTLTGAWLWTEALTPEEIRIRSRAAIHRAADAGMIAISAPSGRLEPTPFGWAAASKGIRIETARDLAAWIAESETRLWSPLDLILAAASTPDGRLVQVPLTAREYHHADYPGMLKRAAQSEDLSADVPLNRFRNCNLQPFFDEVRAIKSALFLTDWIEEVPVYDIEEKYQVLFGQISAAAEQISWLIDATAAVATALGSHPEFIRRIHTVTERVERGMREESLALARLKDPPLERRTVIALAARGLHTPEALAQASEKALTRWMSLCAARALKAWAVQSFDGGAERPREKPPEEAADSSAPVLVVDDRRPDRICIDDKPVPLQDKQYRLIRILAMSPGSCVPYETIYRAVWEDVVVEPNQMHFQKRRLLARIVEAAPGRAELIKTIPKRGFLLDLAPEEVSVIPASVSTAA